MVNDLFVTIEYVVRYGGTRGAISHMEHGFNSNDKLFHRYEKTKQSSKDVAQTYNQGIVFVALSS